MLFDRQVLPTLLIFGQSAPDGAPVPCVFYTLITGKGSISNALSSTSSFNSPPPPTSTGHDAYHFDPDAPDFASVALGDAGAGHHGHDDTSTDNSQPPPDLPKGGPGPTPPPAPSHNFASSIAWSACVVKDTAAGAAGGAATGAGTWAVSAALAGGGGGGLVGSAAGPAGIVAGVVAGAGAGAAGGALAGAVDGAVVGGAGGFTWGVTHCDPQPALASHVSVMNSGGQATTAGSVKRPEKAASSEDVPRRADGYTDTNPPVRLDHITDGDINKAGKAGGFHSRPGSADTANARMKELKDPLNEAGLYTGYVEVRDPTTGNWVTKKSFSTFFPNDLSKKQITDSVLHAFHNGTVKSNGSFSGDSGLGFEIKGYFQDGKIETAYPKTESDQ